LTDGARTAQAVLLHAAQSAIPELDELLKSGLQILEAKTIRRCFDVAAIESLHHRFDAPTGLQRRSRSPAGKKHVVFRLEPLQLGLEHLQVALHV